jgi:hypothetical protein
MRGSQQRQPTAYIVSLVAMFGLATAGFVETFYLPVSVTVILARALAVLLVGTLGFYLAVLILRKPDA